MDKLIIVKYLIILPIVTGFGIAFKEFDDSVLPNEYIPFLLAIVVGVPLAMLIKYMPELAEPITQGLMLAFVGVFGHKVYKFLNNSNKDKTKE
jgi:hypothetical protein